MSASPDSPRRVPRRGESRLYVALVNGSGLAAVVMVAVWNQGLIDTTTFALGMASVALAIAVAAHREYYLHRRLEERDTET